MTVPSTLMDIANETAEKGVAEARFDLKVEDEAVPGIRWRPDGASRPTPTILIGHGGTQHKRVPNVLTNLAKLTWAIRVRG